MGALAECSTSNPPAGVLAKASPPAPYRPRRPSETAFYKLVDKHFDEFEEIYPTRYQAEFGFWRPIIGDVVEEFLKCGDLHHGFARVKCTKCNHDFLVAFSCKKRCFCPSCHQKRLLVFSERLTVEICAAVPHRQFVFTIPKRFRLYFRYDRSLLGKLCLAAWKTIRKVYATVLDDDSAQPGVIGSIQTFGELIHWHPHIHMIVTDGAFRPDGTFLALPKTADEPFLKIWEHEIFRLLLKERLITGEVIMQMRTWRHSGFSVHREVFIKAGDERGIENLAQYIARCPFSMARMVEETSDGGVIYKTDHSEWKKFPHWKTIPTLPGMIRNFEIFQPLDFLAQTTQHIPDRSQHLIRYYGWYSNKARGMRKKTASADMPEAQATVAAAGNPDAPEYLKAARRRWAQLIKKVYEVDPLVCPKCSGPMEIVAFIVDAKSIVKILKHIGQYSPADRAPPRPPPMKPPPTDEELGYYPDPEYAD